MTATTVKQIRVQDIKFPPVGANKKWLITCAGNPFAGFDDHKQALEVMEMYKKRVKPAKGDGDSYNARQEWAVVLNPSYG